jgi:peptidoglycan hydrolase-like protein with peptidoglycan-binding domain
MARELTETEAVRNLQRYLRQLAYFDPELPELPVDGVFDTETQRAVEIFQKSNGLAVTGVADRLTWEAIYAAYLLSLASHAKPEAVDVFYRSASPEALRLGDVGFAVAAVQYMLNEVLTFYIDRPNIDTNGFFGEETLDAVRLFQQYVLLPPTGEVDLETWNRLTKTYNELFRNDNQ